MFVYTYTQVHTYIQLQVFLEPITKLLLQIRTRFNETRLKF